MIGGDASSTLDLCCQQQHLLFRMIRLIFVLSSLCVVSHSLDLGSNGVFDSPLATDQFVKQFGFLFGGGRSGVSGLHALQVRSIIKSFLFTTCKQETNETLIRSGTTYKARRTRKKLIEAMHTGFSGMTAGSKSAWWN